MKSETVITGRIRRNWYLWKEIKNKTWEKQTKKETLSWQGFEFGHSAREAEGLPLYRTKQSLCVLSKIRLLICYTFVFQSGTHILGENYKIDINFTLFTFTIYSSGLPYCYWRIEKSREIVFDATKIDLSLLLFERAKLVYKAALRDERRQLRMSLQNVKMTVILPYRKHWNKKAPEKSLEWKDD